VRITLPRLLAVALVGLCLSSVLWGTRVLREMDAFRVERVEVSGVHLLAPHEVLAASGVRLGQNVWDDPQAWLDALHAHPVIQSATIERTLPRTLLIRVEERRPVALVAAPTLRPATADGRVLPVEPARASVDLPLVRTSAAAGTEAADEESLRLLMEVGRLAQLDPALIARVSEVRSSGPQSLALTLGSPAVELLLPVGADEAQLRRLHAVLDDIGLRTAEIPAAERPERRIHVDLRFADQAVVRFPSSS